MNFDLTQGNETKALIKFTIPMIIGNLFQQLYNVADTIIVGRFIGSNALGAVGSSFAIMVLLTSIILGLCIGSGTVFSHLYGANKIEELKNSFFMSFCLIGLLTLIINISVLVYIDDILVLLQIPQEVLHETKTYLQIIFYGIGFTSIYNYFTSIMRSMGNSVVPLIFLIISAIINIVLDIIFVVPLNMGIAGVAYATIIAQGFSAVGIAIYCLIGYLFLFYGLFRGMGRPEISIVLTILSLGTRVALAYILSPIPSIGLVGIWWSIPIGWALADILGLYIYKRVSNKE